MLKAAKGNRPVVQSKVDSRGRFTLPQLVRKHLGVCPGSRLTFTHKGNGRFIVSVVLDEGQTPHEPEIAAARGELVLPPNIDTTAELIRKGHLIPAAEFQKRMGWATRQAVWKALASKRVFAMNLGVDRYFPAFFSDTAYERKHLHAVTKMLGDLPGGAKMQFFVSRKGSLGGKTTLEALAAGQLEKVLRGAAAYAEV